jgi:hypothetical protein
MGISVIDADWEIVKEGTALYADEVVYSVHILKHGWSYGSGDYEDEPEVQEDREGEFYYIRFKLPQHMGRYSGLEGAYSSFEEAIQRVAIATSGTVTWKE